MLARRWVVLVTTKKGQRVYSDLTYSDDQTTDEDAEIALKFGYYLLAKLAGDEDIEVIAVKEGQTQSLN